MPYVCDMIGRAQKAIDLKISRTVVANEMVAMRSAYAVHHMAVRLVKLPQYRVLGCAVPHPFPADRQRRVCRMYRPDRWSVAASVLAKPGMEGAVLCRRRYTLVLQGIRRINQRGLEWQILYSG